MIITKANVKTCEIPDYIGDFTFFSGFVRQIAQKSRKKFVKFDYKKG